MQLSIRYIFFLFIILGLFACQQQEASSSSRRIKPSALGVMNDIVVVSDKDVWDSFVGDTIRRYFEGYYPLTPRPEPIFDVRHFTHTDVASSAAKKELRTYLIIADLDDPTSEVTEMVIEDLGSERLSRAKSEEGFTTSVGRDKWATGQILIYLFAHGLDDLSSAVISNYNGISAKVNEHDFVQLEQHTYARGRNGGWARDLKARFDGVELTIPSDFQLVKDTLTEDGLFWIRKDDNKLGAVNVALRMYDYEGPQTITKAAAKDRFNLFARKINSSAPNSYALINDVDLPILQYDRQIAGLFAREWRGIWEMENDFMGGPFISYAIVNDQKAKVLVIDALFFAPGVRKRDFMQQMDLVVKSMKW